MKFYNKLIFTTIAFVFIGCYSIETDDPTEAYEYWSKSRVPKEIKILDGNYYKSPHFTYEYEVFLKIEAEEMWIDEMIVQNKMSLDTIGEDWSRFTQLPNWFKPDEDAEIYAIDPHDAFNRTRVFKNSKTGICYIYDTQGM